MKNRIITLLLIAFTVSAIAQKPLTQKEVVQKETIDFSKECIMFRISGLIEIDGHTFLNATCSNPIYYYATLEEVVIKSKDGTVYQHRKCEKEGCEVVHLDYPRRNSLTVPWIGSDGINLITTPTMKTLEMQLYEN